MTLTAAPTTEVVARPPRLRQLPGLDGLRAIAVVAVIVYHLDPGLLPGGYLGVDIFFVISGYLITSLLLVEIGRSGSISLRGFWSRRARRLLPALFFLMGAVVLLAAFFARDALGHMQGDVPASLLYVMNWRLVLHHDSYLASLGRPPLLLHLWSLAVEEQFYLLWPLVLLGLRRRLSSQAVARTALGGAVISAVLMGVLFQPGSDPSGVYFSTPTHAHGFLMGAALAAAVPPWRMASSVPPGARRVLERSGLIALGVVFLGLATFAFDSSVTYRGGMFLIDLATTVLVATVAHPATRLGPILSRQPLRWAGQRSYSLYLWHWPIFEMTRPGTDLGRGPLVLALRILLTVVAAELSYRYIEQPWRAGTAQARLRALLAGGRARPMAYATAGGVVALAAILATAPAPSAPAILLEGSTPAARVAPLVASSTASGPMLAPLPPATDPVSPTSTAAPKGRRTLIRSTPAATTSQISAGPYLPVLAVGDSVLLAASPTLQARYGSEITIDAAIGRQVSAGISRLAAYRSSGALFRYRAVMVDLGTNGAFQPWQFARMVSLLAGVPRVVVYDVHADRPWVPTSNATITAGVSAHPGQMRLADWNRLADQPNLLYPDGIHPNDVGARVYGQLLAAQIDAAGAGAPATPRSTTTTTAPAPTTSTTATTAPAASTTTSPPTTARPTPSTTSTTKPATTSTLPRPPG